MVDAVEYPYAVLEADLGNAQLLQENLLLNINTINVQDSSRHRYIISKECFHILSEFLGLQQVVIKHDPAGSSKHELLVCKPIGLGLASKLPRISWLWHPGRLDVPLSPGDSMRLGTYGAVDA